MESGRGLAVRSRHVPAAPRTWRPGVEVRLGVRRFAELTDGCDSEHAAPAPAPATSSTVAVAFERGPQGHAPRVSALTSGLYSGEFELTSGQRRSV
jgi:hypothetical protein